jgi:hypothetical protein
MLIYYPSLVPRDCHTPHRIGNRGARNKLEPANRQLPRPGGRHRYAPERLFKADSGMLRTGNFCKFHNSRQSPANVEAAVEDQGTSKLDLKRRTPTAEPAHLPGQQS